MGRMSLRWRKAFTTVRHTFGKVRLALIGDEQLIKIHSQNFVCYSWEEEFLFVSRPFKLVCHVDCLLSQLLSNKSPG